MYKYLLKVNLMYFLVSEVYAQLLKTIVIKHLKSIYVQQFQHFWLTLFHNLNIKPRVKFHYDPVEQRFIHSFSNWVSSQSAVAYT